MTNTNQGIIRFNEHWKFIFGLYLLNLVNYVLLQFLAFLTTSLTYFFTFILTSKERQHDAKKSITRSL